LGKIVLTPRLSQILSQALDHFLQAFIQPTAIRGQGDRLPLNFALYITCDDHAVNLLFTRDAAGLLTGILVNLACPSQCDEAKAFFSADFWHDVRQGIAARYGAAVHLLPQCAPAGDLSPHLQADQTEEKDLRDRGVRVGRFSR
jgi:hypothetical protein